MLLNFITYEATIYTLDGTNFLLTISVKVKLIQSRIDSRTCKTQALDVSVVVNRGVTLTLSNLYDGTFNENSSV